MATNRGSAVGGGIVISDSTIDTGGGDIVGRDKIHSATVARIEEVFYPITQAIEAAAPAKKIAAQKQLRALKSETAKGKGANDSKVAKLVDGLVGLVPGAVSAIVSAFATPILGGIAGPVTKFVLERIQAK